MNDSLPDDTNESEDVAPKAELEPEHKDYHQTESSVESGEQNITSENIQFITLHSFKNISDIKQLEPCPWK